MPYRIGLLADGTEVSKWVRDFAAWADAHPDFEIAAVITHPAPQASARGLRKFAALARDKGLYVALSRAAFALTMAAERALACRSPHFRDHFRTHPIDPRVPVIETKPIVSKSGIVYRFGEDDLQRIRALELDALVRCGNGILKGEILSAARDGVISLHHADNRVNRGGPAGFWEVYEGRPQTGFVVQRLTEELDGGAILCRGSVSTEMVYTRNKAIVADRATAYLGRTLEKLARGEAKAEPPHVYDSRLYKTPLLHETLAYAAGVAGDVARRLVRRAFGHRAHWGVAYLFQPWQGAVLWRGKTLPRPPGAFIADPFAIQVDGSHYVFVEELPYKSGKGVISVYRVSPTEAQRIGIVLNEPYHLSFPFLFRYREDIYMIPESAADRSIKLYRATRFPEEWALEKVIAADVAAVDTVVFERDGRWWMLTTIRGEDRARNDAELHAFWAPDPLGEWTAHPANPVIVDASRGRNGGLLRDRDGTIYRVTQRHGFARYGTGISIYRIDELSEDAYSERWVQDIEPKFFKGIVGTHHLHEDSGLTVYDFYADQRPR